MLTVAKQFGGLNNRHQPHLIGPSVAQDLSNVDIDSQGIRPINGLGASVAVGVGTPLSIYKFNGHWIVDTIAWKYAEYRGVLYRAATGQTPQKSADGVTFVRLGIVEPPQPGAPTDAGAGAISGNVEYYATYVTSFGTESAPSPVSASIAVLARQVNVPVTASADPQVTGIRLYRAGDTGGTLKVGADLANATATIVDNVAAAALGVALPTAAFTTPPQLDGIVAAPFGRLLGWSGKSLYYCTAPLGADAGTDTWYPAPIPFNDTIVAVVPMRGSTPVLTASAPYVLTGNGPNAFAIQGTGSGEGCVARDTAIDMGGTVFWRSPNGICSMTGTQVEVISKQFLSDAFMAGIPAAGLFALRSSNRYWLFVPAACTSFPAGGYLEYDPLVGPPWKKGTITGTAGTFSIADNAMFLASGVDVKQWGAGAAATFSYQTGDWSGEAPQLLKSYRRASLQHNGTNTVDTTVDGAAAGAQQAPVRASLGPSTWFYPNGSIGQRIAFTLGGTGLVTAIALEEFQEQDV